MPSIVNFLIKTKPLIIKNILLTEKLVIDIISYCKVMIEKIQNEILDCCKCGNLKKLKEVSIQIGTTPFIIIGESPAKDGWIISHKAFYNKDFKLQASGRTLEKLLNEINYSIKDIYFTECCKCIIEDRKLLTKASKNCFSILLEQIKSIPCRILVPMGIYPTQVLLGVKIKKFSNYVGKIFKINIEGEEYKVFPIYHPSPLNPKGYSGNISAFQLLREILN